MKLSFATLQDTEKLMKFLDEHWKKDHILSQDKNLFLYEFQEGERLNFGIAKDADGEILGLFGFMKYNSLSLPDLAGSLWKVKDDCKVPLLGLKLREFVVNNIKHRFFAAPGAGIQTKPIYQIIKMDWNQMEQYYFPNPTIKDFQILKLPDSLKKTHLQEKNVNEQIKINKVKEIDELQQFDFKKYQNIVPFKDLSYIQKRFVNHPIYSYDIYTVKKEKRIENIFICRSVDTVDSKAYRIVDFYGFENNMDSIVRFLSTFIIENKYEYFDFLCHGFNKDKMLSAGLYKVDFESEVVVPNFFEPFVQKNIPVYCVSDRIEESNMHFRQCKADGDQDRPNRYRSSDEQ